MLRLSRAFLVALPLGVAALAGAPPARADASPIACVLVARGVEGEVAQPVADAVCAELAVKGAERGTYEVTVEARAGSFVVGVRDPADPSPARRASGKTLEDASAAAPRLAGAVADGRPLDEVEPEPPARPDGATTLVHLRGSPSTLYGRAPGEATWKLVCTSPCERGVPTAARYRVHGANGQDELSLPPTSATVTVGSRSTPAFVLGVGLMVVSSVALSAAYVGAVSRAPGRSAPGWVGPTAIAGAGGLIVGSIGFVWGVRTGVEVTPGP